MMSPQLTYLPAYGGLFASLLLAIACNAFLDIQYGSFGTEILLWGIAFAWTLRIGWRQHGTDGADGKQKQLIVLIIGGVASIIIFMPLWGFPRAGLAMLGVLQAAQNCVTTTRRHLYFGLLVSLVMVMFATAHYRADWTMLFYLVPYIVAVVLTLVSEQISQQAEAAARSSLVAAPAGRGAAILAASGGILALGLTLYLLTPQVTWPYLHSRYGLATNLGFLGETQEGAPGQQPGGTSGQAGGGGGSGSGNGAGDGLAEEGDSGQPGLRERAGPTPGEMRQAARRPGMPGWQSTAIMKLADFDESLSDILKPLQESIEQALKDLKRWFEENRGKVISSLLALLLLLLLAGLAFLLREVKAATWLRTRYDFLRLGLFARHQPGRVGAAQYFRAMERLFTLHDLPRSRTTNTREYLAEITQIRDHLRQDTTTLIGHFEAASYGPRTPDAGQLAAMRAAYRQLFRQLG